MTKKEKDQIELASIYLEDGATITASKILNELIDGESDDSFDQQFGEHMDKLYNDEPAKLLHFMVVSAGKMCADANAETMDLSAEMTFENTRFKTDVKVTMVPLGSAATKMPEDDH